MRKFSKLHVTAMLILMVALIVGGLKIYKSQSLSTLKSTANAKAKGNPSAAVKIVEYIDFQCPACAQGAIFLKKYIAENPDKIYLEMRYFPLSMHKHAFLSARYAECAAHQGKFWPFHDALVEKQDQWKGLYDAKPAFESLAQDAGIDMNKIRSCINDPQTEKTIMDQKTEGTIRGVQSTPTYFINGKLVVGYLNLMNALKEYEQE